MARRGALLVVRPDGSFDDVPNSYEGIKEGLDQAAFDFVRLSAHVGAYIDDEGMLKSFELNVPVSMMFSRPLYGPAVLCHGDADHNGDTLPPSDSVKTVAMDMAVRWAYVLGNAVLIGQDISVRAVPESIPPPSIVQFRTEEELEAYLNYGTIPDNQTGEENV
jgi:hypothetical protein